MPPRKIDPRSEAKPPRDAPPGVDDSRIGPLPPQPDNEPLPRTLPGRHGDWVKWLGRDLSALDRENFERDIRRILRSVAMTDSLFPRGPGTLSPPLLVTGGGSARLDRSGVNVYNGNVNTIRLEDDGDAFFGSNLAAPATTSFIVFSNAQTYNSESMGAGDLLLGDNGASKANILWDASAGKMLFRGGLVDNVILDTDGALEIDSTGFDSAAEKRPLRIINTTHSHHLQLTNFDLNVTLAGGSIGMRVPNPGGAVTYPSVATSFVADTAGSPNIHYVLQSVATSATDNVQAFVVADVTNTLAKFYLVGAGAFAGTERLGIGLAPSVPLQVKSGVFIQAGAAGATIFNEDSYDIDFRIESDTRANAVILDAGLHAFQIGGATVSDVAGDIADFRAATIVFNEGSNDIDFRVEGNGTANLFIVDAGLGAVQISSNTVPLFPGDIATFGGATIVFNENSNDFDFRVESNGNANMLIIDGGLDAAAIGGAAVSGKALSVYGDFQGRGFIGATRTALTIATGAVTATGSFHTIDTEGAAATDDLDTINGGSLGDILVLITANSARDVTVRDASVSGGNINTAGAASFTLTSVAATMMLMQTVTGSWQEISRSAN